MTAAFYVIRTPQGYVGRRSVQDRVTDTMPLIFASTYTDEIEAELSASFFDRAEVVDGEAESAIAKETQ